MQSLPYKLRIFCSLLYANTRVQFFLNKRWWSVGSEGTMLTGGSIRVQRHHSQILLCVFLTEISPTYKVHRPGSGVGWLVSTHWLMWCPFIPLIIKCGKGCAKYSSNCIWILISSSALPSYPPIPFTSKTRYLSIFFFCLHPGFFLDISKKTQGGSGKNSSNFSRKLKQIC